MGTELASRRWVGGLAGLALLVALVATHGPSSDEAPATRELSLDRESLQAKLRECRRQVTPHSDTSCQAASEAWRRRFLAGSTTADTDSTDSDPGVGGRVAPYSAGQSSPNVRERP